MPFNIARLTRGSESHFGPCLIYFVVVEAVGRYSQPRVREDSVQAHLSAWLPCTVSCLMKSNLNVGAQRYVSPFLTHPPVLEN